MTVVEEERATKRRIRCMIGLHTDEMHYYGAMPHHRADGLILHPEMIRKTRHGDAYPSLELVCKHCGRMKD